ncbi:MAG: FAD-dependent oxidoreductase [Pyrinomonadaceae bacterium]
MNESEVTVARLSDIGDGEMKEISVEGVEVLLARINGECFAVGAHCTHYGAPLVEGALVGDRIICPWHHACFNAKNGELLEPPALDALPSFPVKIDGDEILITLSDDSSDRGNPGMAERDQGVDDRTIAIIGAGAAGYSAAQALREFKFQGRIVMISREDRSPYDRPNLSKDYLQGRAEPEWMPLRSDDFFEQHEIEMLRPKEVERVDASSKSIEFTDGTRLVYDCLLVASGSSPRRLDLANSDLENIFVLRDFDQADELIKRCETAKRVVVVGASFIAMEAAASLRQRGLEVTVVAPDGIPFERILGDEIGGMFKVLHKGHGVEFRLETSIQGFEQSGEKVDVLLGSGERLAADLVLLGIGVVPETGFLSGVEIHQDGSVIVDEFLCAGEDVYVAGDIATFPDSSTSELIRIEHWRFAMQQGRAAAYNMAHGYKKAFKAIPFFWTTQFDATLNYVGHARQWDRILIDGDVDAQEFLAFYFEHDHVKAVAGMGRDRALAIAEEVMRCEPLASYERFVEALNA